MISANSVMDAAAAGKKSFGTPLTVARARENTATGINAANERPNMDMLPVLRSLFAVAKSPVPVASATYF